MQAHTPLAGATRKNFSRAEFKAAYRACRIDWRAVKPATWTLAHGAAMYALGGDCRVGKDESKRRCYRIKYLAEANRNRHAGIDTSGYDYL